MIGTIIVIFGLLILLMMIIPIHIFIWAMPPICTQDCYNVTTNSHSKGFSPHFLAQQSTKQVCKESHPDLVNSHMPDLKYCSKTLNTL